MRGKFEIPARIDNGSGEPGRTTRLELESYDSDIPVQNHSIWVSQPGQPRVLVPYTALEDALQRLRPPEPRPKEVER